MTGAVAISKTHGGSVSAATRGTKCRFRRLSPQTPARGDDGADHQREDEKDQADHAAPPVADAARDEHEAPKQDGEEFHGYGAAQPGVRRESSARELGRAKQKLRGNPKAERDQQQHPETAE